MDERRGAPFELTDRDGHVVRFNGALLGEASSEQPGKERWAEICIFKTDGGSYVVSGVGRSIVDGEVDRSWVQVSERPQGVIEKLHRIDDGGARYMPDTNRDALQQACDADQALAEAFSIEVVD